MNILCIDQFFNLGGGQRSLLDLLPAFTNRGWRVSVAAPGEGPFIDEVRKLGVDTHALNLGEYVSGVKPVGQILRYGARVPALSLKLNRLVRMLGADLLYVNGPRLVPPAALVARKTGIPLVFHCHNRLSQQFAISLTGRSLQFARARVIACCEHAVIPTRKYIDNSRISVVFNGVQPVIRSGSPPLHPARRIGVVGRIEQEKGQLAFVKAAWTIAGNFPNCQFVIVGAPLFSDDAYFRQVVAASRGLPVEFAGWQNDLSAIFSNLDLLVVPSAPLEATTRVILEAYSSGVPVVAFPSGGIPEVLKDNETGFLAEDITPAALAHRIVAVLRLDAVHVNDVVRRARQAWSRQFCLDLYREKVCDYLALDGKRDNYYYDRKAAPRNLRA